MLFVIDGTLVTPSFESGVLRGITKGAIARFGSAIGLTLQERELKAREIDEGDRMFCDERDAGSDAGGIYSTGERHVARVSGGRR